MNWSARTGLKKKRNKEREKNEKYALSARTGAWRAARQRGDST